MPSPKAPLSTILTPEACPIPPQSSHPHSRALSVPVSPHPKHRLVYLLDLLYELVLRDLKLRYRRSVLGIFWTLLNPLAQLLVLSLVFGRVLPLNIPNYPLFLFTGLLVWNWFQASLHAGAASIVDNRDLVRRPGFPAAVLPVVTVAANFIHFLLALPVLLGFMFLSGVPLSPAFLTLPLIFAVQFLLCLSLIYFLAALQVTFWDTQYLVGILLYLGFYLTPVFYDIAALPPPLQSLYRLNPLVPLLDANRSVFVDAAWPALTPLVWVGLFSAILLRLTYRVFRQASLRFAEEL
jgi:lipopolysaccharide transport system permease protein